MASFSKKGTLAQFQTFIKEVYSIPDDRLYSIWDILTQQQRFTMRALKGIRKGDLEKLKYNLLISLSWLMAIANRLHIGVEGEVWKRFPYLCSYCGKLPCKCKSAKTLKRVEAKINEDKRPKILSDLQKMFAEIYPPQSRTLSQAGVHLAEEMGEVAESIHNYLGEHHKIQFQDVKFELADFVSCIFGVANSAKIDVAKGLEKQYSNNCHVCHKAPCQCSFSEVASMES